MLDIKALRKAKFSQREEEITLTALADAGMGDGIVRVRGLTAHQLAEAEEAATKGRLVSDLVEKLAGSGREKVDALLEGIGFNQDVPASLAKKLSHVQMGVVEPELQLEDVVKLAEAFPIEFGQLANKIYELTGKGQVAQVKRQPSGGGQTSKPA